MRKFALVFIAVLTVLILTGCPEALMGAYTVYYNGNGAETGTTPTDINLYEEGSVVTIWNNTGNLQKYNVVFSGWNTEPDGSGIDRNVGETFNMETEILVLYAKWKSDFAVGDTGPAGGCIFYVDEVDVFSWDYLEAAPSDFSSFLNWEGGLNTVSTTAINPAIGYGYDNTMRIISYEGIGDYAASRCYDLTIGSYNDWFLPSEDELLLIRLAGIDNFEHTTYWCSTELSSNYSFANYVTISNGDVWIDLKTNAYGVRAARAF
jgi:hypothetical protein